MKSKYTAAIFAALLSFNSFASCSISKSTASNAVRSAMKEGYDIEENKFESICNKLNSANAALAITGEVVILKGKLIAWATINLKDKNSDIISMDYGNLNTVLSDEASMHLADSKLNRVISDAIKEMDIDSAIEALNRKRAKAYKK